MNFVVWTCRMIYPNHNKNNIFFFLLDKIIYLKAKYGTGNVIVVFCMQEE